MTTTTTTTTTTETFDDLVARAVVFNGSSPVSEMIQEAGSAESPADLDRLAHRLQDAKNRAHAVAGPAIDSFLDEIADVREWRNRCSMSGWPHSLAPRYRRVVDGTEEEARRLIVAVVLHQHHADTWEDAVEKFESEVERAARWPGTAVGSMRSTINLLAELKRLDCIRLLAKEIDTRQTHSQAALIAVAALRRQADNEISGLEVRRLQR